MRALGSEHLDLAENAVQDAFLQAMRTWPLRGVPERPDAWLYRTARNAALDALRRSARFAARAPALAHAATDGAADAGGPAAHFPGEVVDDALRLMFLCCHPSLPPASRVALTLKVAAGFSTDEIARAFLASETTVAQRIVRAKRTLRETGASFAMPGPRELATRVDDVLDSLFLVFGEGYRPHAGEAPLRRDLMEEAIRLLRIVREHPAGGSPRADALLALMLFQASRLDARLDGDGALVPLERQDRTRWDRARIDEGTRLLAAAARGEELSDYHLLAGIAACHALAGDAAATDWPRIVELYDLLLEAGAGDVARLNRAVAVSYVQGPAEALRIADALAAGGTLADYPLLPAVRADLLRRLGCGAEAAAAFRDAERRAVNLPERRWYAKQAAALGD